MDILDLFASGTVILIGTLLIAAPLIIYRGLFDTARHWHAYGPGRAGVAELCGFLIGLCFILTTPLPGGGLNADLLFGVGGPWDLDPPAFEALVLDILDKAPDRLAAWLAERDDRLNLTLIVGFALALLGARGAWGFYRAHWRMAMLTLAMDLTLAALASVATLYAMLLGLWLLNRLNFWALAVAVLVMQEYRYNTLGLFQKQRHFRAPKSMLPLGAPVSGNGNGGKRIRAGGSTRATGRKFGV
ncbi:hypothetical protein AZL_b00440 (plasmid) [Azospirillum sp. B510]|uniref:hypothetical protein n=1 Tax=Azospirillum sp. (strain B510) TaxID=137722 RepID=UPI0001C4C9B9|nr:hypothetical protein [Azospirillum sp. B510]BAI74707.1 hypothetical protein AZL_b00440 [Azospirillum sp. B510]